MLPVVDTVLAYLYIYHGAGARRGGGVGEGVCLVCLQPSCQPNIWLLQPGLLFSPRPLLASPGIFQLQSLVLGFSQNTGLQSCVVQSGAGGLLLLVL